MVTVTLIDTKNKSQVNQFVSFPYRLYRSCPQWVPPLRMDIETALNRDKHPYFGHSTGDFFIAARGNEVVGRIAVFENTLFNQVHGKKSAHFYFFECIEDREVANALFNRAFEWARERGLDHVVGPKGTAPLDGYGMLVEGFEHRQMMTMMNYNFAYYNTFAVEAGFRKEVDFVSCYASPSAYKVPERVHRIADRVRARGELRVLRFENKAQLKPWINKVGRAYNDAFINNWEYYPLTDAEVKFIADNILAVANPKMLKVILHENDVVGFLFAFPDLSRGLQQARGRLFPLGLPALLLDMRQTDWVSVNGIGILPEFHGRGGNALLYSEMDHTLSQYPFKHVEMTQVAETATQMRQDLINLGGLPYKNHRVYRRDL